mmetsp:Transcript_6839/g.9664  ORF Transcript_6839/g.9664 Transcript_6839/m.9664 type:complete len:120 (-) Transcript_6839:114-473(-)
MLGTPSATDILAPWSEEETRASLSCAVAGAGAEEYPCLVPSAALAVLPDRSEVVNKLLIERSDRVRREQLLGKDNPGSCFSVLFLGNEVVIRLENSFHGTIPPALVIRAGNLVAIRVKG